MCVGKVIVLSGVLFCYYTTLPCPSAQCLLLDGNKMRNEIVSLRHKVKLFPFSVFENLHESHFFISSNRSSYRYSVLVEIRDNFLSISAIIYSAPFEAVPYTEEPFSHHWLKLQPP